MMTEPELYEFSVGHRPLLINVPHAGTFIPADVAAEMTDVARATPDTDWHVHRLCAFAAELGASLLVATHSRYVVDLNRDPQNVALYVGADNTELCPTRTFANEPIYRDARGLGPAAIEARRARYWQPYHDRLGALLTEIHAKHGHVVLLDAHSIRSRVPRFFDGRLPDLNLGTADGRSCSPEIQRQAEQVLACFPRFTRVVNGRFKGGYITRHYGQPAEGFEALQLEIAQSSYMDETSPESWSPAAAESLAEVLEELATALSNVMSPQ